MCGVNAVGFAVMVTFLQTVGSFLVGAATL